jgi:hypothetical protein
MTQPSPVIVVGWDWEGTASEALSWAADYARRTGRCERRQSATR